jgi:CTP:phosphocholine cytidylyltransferase-like protein
MKQSNKILVKPKTRVGKRIKKYEDFVTIILLHDQPCPKKRTNASFDSHSIFLIDQQVSAIHKKFSNYEIIICTGFISTSFNLHIKNKYKKFNVRVIENKDFETCNSCESVRLCLQNTNNSKIFIINGKILFDYKIFNNLDLSEAFAISSSNKEYNLDVGLNVDGDKNVAHFSYGAKKHWTEILFLSNHGIIKDLENILINSIFRKKFLFEAINEIIPKNKIVFTKSSSGKAIKIQNLKTLNLIGKNK